MKIWKGPKFLVPESGQYCWHFGLPPSSRLVIITMEGALSCHTSLQKSTTVLGRGPEGMEYVSLFQILHSTGIWTHTLSGYELPGNRVALCGRVRQSENLSLRSLQTHINKAGINVVSLTPLHWLQHHTTVIICGGGTECTTHPPTGCLTQPLVHVHTQMLAKRFFNLFLGVVAMAMDLSSPS